MGFGNQMTKRKQTNEITHSSNTHSRNISEHVNNFKAQVSSTGESGMNERDLETPSP
jgi:hypothetical protein